MAAWMQTPALSRRRQEGTDVVLRLPPTGQIDKAVRERAAAVGQYFAWSSPSHRCHKLILVSTTTNLTMMSDENQN